jgi:hypothetical protein
LCEVEVYGRSKCIRLFIQYASLVQVSRHVRDRSLIIRMGMGAGGKMTGGGA